MRPFLTAACRCFWPFPPDFVLLLVEVALSDRSAGRDVGVLEVVTTEAGYVKGTDLVYSDE